MKNREKYAEELLDIACTGKNIAIDTIDRLTERNAGTIMEKSH